MISINFYKENPYLTKLDCFSHQMYYHMHLSKLFIYCLFVFSIYSCTSTSGTTESTAEKVDSKAMLNEVKCFKLKSEVFSEELISNGKINAQNKCELYFEQALIIENLPVRNGAAVQKGDLLAILENADLKLKLSQSEQNFEKTKLELENILIGQGYAIKDSIGIPKKVLRIAKLKSGYLNARNNLHSAKLNLQSAFVYAPFSGVLANMESRVFDKASLSKPFCTLISSDVFRAEFTLIESELAKVKLGQIVRSIPFNGKKTYSGTISGINPTIDEYGLVKLSATIPNTDGHLIDGMNVKLVIENKIQNQLIVPRSAVLLRQNKEVIFVHENGQAIWKYVVTDKENESSYTIKEGLQEGDEVIVSGNLNLAHESAVKVVK